MDVQFKILGPIEIELEARTARVPRGRALSLLALLLVRHGAAVHLDRVVDELWEGDGERHEALRNRAVVKGHRGQFVAADWSKLGAAYPSERAEWVASSPDNDGTDQYCQMVRVRQA